MPKLIGWDLFHLNCKSRQEDFCRALLQNIIEAGHLDSSESVPDKDIACTPENCGVWECMEDGQEIPCPKS